MPFYKTSIAFQPELSTGTTNFLLGEVMNKIVATIETYAEWKSTAVAVTNTFSFTNGGNTITRLTGSWITDGWTVGDLLAVTGANASNNKTAADGYSVTNVSALVLTCSGNFGFTEDSATAVVHGITPVTDMDFLYNLIENSDPCSFDSLVDTGNTQRLKATGLDCEDTTPISFSFQGTSKAWTNGSATVEGTSASDWDSTTYQQGFKIIHTFYILPWFLDSELTQLDAGLPFPDRFDGIECLGYCWEVDGYFSPVDISRKHTYTETNFPDGNTGWFDEWFNGNVPGYHVASIAYQDTLTADTLTALQYCRDTDFQIVLHSTGNKFSNNNTKFVLNFSYLPLNSTQYQNTLTDIESNFMFDRCQQTVGAGAVNGDNWGTNTQVLKSVTAIFTSTGIIVIQGTVSLAAALTTAISGFASTNRNYLLAVEIQDHTKTTTQSDLVTVKCDVNEFTCNLDEQVFYVSDYVHFNDHPHVGSLVGYNNFDGWIEDGCLAHTVFKIDETDSATFDKLSIVFETEHATYTGFELERRDIVALLNTSRNFKLPVNDEKNWVRLIRRYDLDTGNFEFYELFYAFKIRWEDWISLSVPIPTNIPITKQNEKWSNFTSIPLGWSIKINLYAYTTISGYQTVHKHQCNCSAYNYDKPTTWTGYIETFDQAGNNLNLGILGFANTHVKATFQKVSTNFPANLYGILEIEKYQQGGLQNIRQISSLFPPEPG